MVAIGIGVAVVAVEAPDGWATDARLVSRLGVVAATLLALSGVLAAHRAVTGRTPMPAVISVAMIGPGAVWTWQVFVEAAVPPEVVTNALILATAGLAIVLFGRGLQAARWLEVFSGLALLGLTLTATVVSTAPQLARAGLTVVLLAAVSGMASLYGLLVDLELARSRSVDQLLEAKRWMEEEVRRTEGLLHDLRSGLLSIEAAIATMDPGLAGPIRSEAARLRRLTATDGDEPAPAQPRRAPSFDIAEPIRDLVAMKRNGGTEIHLVTPTRAMVSGIEPDIMAIVDNLVSNAQRHGRPPITITIAAAGGATTLRVADAGRGVRLRNVSRIFEPGVTSHPDGAGLGLARARTLAHRNGATLELDPVSGEGAVFVLTLSSAVADGAA